MKDEAKNWYLRFDCADWFLSTITMSPAERGIHINLLAWSFINGAVPDNDEAVAITGGDMKTIRKVLLSRWKLTDGGWRCTRLEIERDRCEGRSVKASVAAELRWANKPDAYANAMPSHMPTQCDGNAIQSNSQSKSNSQNNTTDSLEPRTKRARRQVVGITWDAVSGFQNVTDSHKITWQFAYPNCAVETTLARMHVWLIANPSKAHKTNWLRFIANWFARTREDGGNLPPVQRPTESNF